MVGVAGKSKGCTTCRRRKIRCSQERPYCAICAQTGRSCEGYERFPVFINRTAQGLQKRKPLEEAKPDNSASVVVAQTAEVCSRLLPLSPSSGEAWSMNFLNWFWESYSPTDRPLRTEVTGPLWLYHAMDIPHPTETLRQSLLGLSIVRRGRTNNDINLMGEGRHIYGRALRFIQKDLFDPVRVSHEETLAATRVMALYELYEATTSTAVSWQYHVSGLTSLMKSRGPWNYATPLARALFEEFRYPLMVQCITTRKACPLADRIWSSAPWINVTKDKEQLLYDLGFSLASLLEQNDVLRHPAPENTKFSALSHLTRVIKSGLELNNALNEFRTNYLKHSKILAKDNLDSTYEHHLKSHGQQSGLDIELESLAMTWWALKVIVAFDSRRLSAIACQVTPYLSAPRLCQFDAVIRQLEALYSDASRDDIGRQVLATLEFILHSNMGHFWFSRTIFPITAASLQFHRSGPDLVTCGRIKEQITRRKGFHFAQRLTSQSGLQIAFVDAPTGNTI